MEKLAILSTSPLFEMLSNQELEYVAELTEPRHFEAGATVFDEGELGDSLFVIVQGELEVLRRESSGLQQSIITLGPPEFFGEMSLIDKEYRSATVRAKTEASLLQLTSEKLTQFRRVHKDGFTYVVINIARVLSSRLRESNRHLSVST
jgi:CRP-like cAMP-binding protein